jgi:hypothetical protein
VVGARPRLCDLPLACTPPRGPQAGGVGPLEEP